MVSAGLLFFPEIVGVNHLVRELCTHHMILGITVGGVPSPAAEPPGSGGRQEGRRVGEASRPSRPGTGLKSPYGPPPPGSPVST